jgi:glycosyltransferase involved in cell wall biosynthesis
MSVPYEQLAQDGLLQIGAANATWELARALVQLGHHPIVLTARFRDRNPAATPAGVTLIEVPALRRRREACTPFEMATFAVSASLRVRRILRRERIDGMIAFFSIPCGPIAWWGARGTGVPYIVSLRGGDVPGTEPGLDPIHRLLGPARRRVLKASRTVIANSEALQQRAIAADALPVGVIPNGVDSSYFVPPAGKPPPQPFRWLFVGRLQAQKNLGWLLTRLAALKDQPWELHVVGDGPLREEWQRLAETLDIAGRVQWHGWLPREHVRSFYQNSHALAQPSLYEGMANTVLEAMACGLGIVASDAPANRALVEASGSGTCLPLANPGAAEAILRAAMTGDGWKQWGNHARAHAVAHLSWSQVAKDYASLLAPRLDF